MEQMCIRDRAQSSAELDSLRVQYLGKKGELTACLLYTSSRFVHRELLSRKAHLFLRIISITPNRQNINIKITKYSIKNYI